LIGIVCKKKAYGFCEQTLGLETFIDRHSQRAEVGPRYYVALLFLQPFSLTSFLGFFVFAIFCYNYVDLTPGMDVR